MRRAGWAAVGLACCLVQPVLPQQLLPPAIPVYKVNGMPSWLRLGAEERTRYETTNRRYDGDPTSDQQLALRGRFNANAAKGAFQAQLETQYAEVALTDSGSRLDQRFVGGAWLTRANLSWQARPGVSITGGRMTIDLGGRRLIARNVYRNTVNVFDGVRMDVSHGDWALQAMLVRPALAVGPPGKQFVQGGKLGAVNLGRKLPHSLQAEVFGIWLRDSKTSPVSRGRHLFTGGGRLLRNPEARKPDFEWELTGQGGSVLNVKRRASMSSVNVGYTFAAKHRPRLAFLHFYASGDRDPNDGHDGTFDNLFGARRFDLGPTGTYNLFQRANLQSPAYQFTLSPWKDSDFWFIHRWMHLASARDGWQGSVLKDPTGSAGRDIGQQFEWRIRTPLRRDLLFEGGCTMLREGSFISRVLARPPGWTSYVHAALELRFQVAGTAKK